MPLQVQTSLMVGGLDLVTPPIAMPPGKAISACNYEPDVAGYTSFGGYERFDGHARPSDATDPADIENRRNFIQPVPGTGPVRGVWVYDGAVYAFRDQPDNTAGMFRATLGGWAKQAFGDRLEFGSATHEFTAGEFVTGATSGAYATIARAVLREGVYDGSASGYLVVTGIVGTFASQENISSTLGGAGIGLGTKPIVLQAGGRYDFLNHNFYGAAYRERMYFANGVDTAYEYNGTVMAPALTGQSAGTGFNYTFLQAALPPISNAEDIFADNGDQIAMSALFDAPAFVAQYKNHLFLGYASGSLVNSSLGEPLQYITTTGAGEISFGEPLTGLLSAASTALVIFGQNRIEYLTGSDSSTFQMQPLSDSSGAQPYTAQMMDQPVFLDDGGVRSMVSTSAFGDWRMGSLTQAIEKLTRLKRDNPDIHPAASMRIKSKDQYRLFWDDNTGITVYIGRKYPEALPFCLPICIYSACAGEVEDGHGDRLFVGTRNGFVYEMNRGTSFDGLPIDSYIRLPFTAASSPMQHTRWTKATFEIDTPDDISVGVAFDVDYAKGDGGGLTQVPVDHGTQIIDTGTYATVDWTRPVEGRLEYHLAGIGPNIAALLVHSASNKRQHTISSQTYNFSRRRLKR